MSAKKTTEPITPDPRDDVRVYLGPTLHKRTLVTASLYRGGLSDHVKRVIEKIPELRTLIVPLSGAARAKRRIGEQGTEENRVYRYLVTVRFKENGEVRG